LIIGTLHLLLEYLIVFDFLYKIPFISTLQYIASGALGSAVYKGGLASALLGLVFHYLIAFVIAAVFILGANKSSITALCHQRLAAFWGGGFFCNEFHCDAAQRGAKGAVYLIQFD